MSNAVAQIYTAANFPAAFVRNMGLGLWPMGIKTSQIQWASSYELIEGPPLQTLLHFPILQKDSIDDSNSIASLRARLKSDGEQHAQAAHEGRRTFSNVYFELHKVVIEAQRHWPKMDYPSIEINDLAHAALERYYEREDEQRMGINRAVLWQTIGKDLLSAAVMLLGGIGDKSSIETAAGLLLKSAEMYSHVLGPDANALLKELACAAYSKFFLRLNKSDDLHGKYQKNWRIYREQAVAAWSMALPSALDPDYDTVRIFGGLRACLASDVHYKDMIPFLARYSQVHPDTAIENNLRMAWAQMAGADASEADWNSAISLMDNVVKAWERNDPSSAQVKKLNGLLSSANSIVSQMSQQAS